MNFDLDVVFETYHNSSPLVLLEFPGAARCLDPSKQFQKSEDYELRLSGADFRNIVVLRSQLNTKTAHAVVVRYPGGKKVALLETKK